MENPEIPAELKSRRGGCRAGVKCWERTRQYEPCLPSVVVGSLCSLSNKMDELAALTRLQYGNLVFFTELWLNEDILDSMFSLNGFTLLRGD